ncbi:MAG TPA: hypothetical protein VJM50_00675, partial [Pyrinomonadaceae bacterium]|nr:hypothetical protein [Pyrinomonadaceae bacterium]
MISEGGTQLHRALSLPARDAARRFMPRRVKVEAREAGWRPMALRWGKRGKRLAHVIVRRVGGSTKFVSFPQFHFHIANHQTRQSSTHVSRARISSTRVLDTRIFRDEVRGGVRPASLSLKRFANQPARVIRGALPPTLKLRRSETPVLSDSKPKSFYAVPAPVLRPRKYLFSRPSINAVRPITTKDDLVSPRPQSRIVQYWTPSFAPRLRSQSGAHSEHAHESAVLTQYQRTE